MYASVCVLWFDVLRGFKVFQFYPEDFSPGNTLVVQFHHSGWWTLRQILEKTIVNTVLSQNDG